jgi:hypothetical protein
VLTGSGLGQQNASTRRCCSPIRSDHPNVKNYASAACERRSRTHVSLSVELIRHSDRDRVTILWPARPTSASAAKFPELISVITRLLGNAGMELARTQAANSPHTS